MHQMMELVMGSMTGVATLVGLTMLLFRRVSDVRIRRTSNAGDLIIAGLLWLTLVVGLATLPFSYETRYTGEYLHALSGWAQGIVTLSSTPATLLANVPWMFKFHILCGLTVFLVFPFTRLVHVCSAPLGYLIRRHTQIVRARQGG
jgi:nitrate reductase gamma subunit